MLSTLRVLVLTLHISLYVFRYTPQSIELETKVKPFIPDFIPAVGDIDAFIKVTVSIDPQIVHIEASTDKKRTCSERTGTIFRPKKINH